MQQNSKHILLEVTTIKLDTIILHHDIIDSAYKGKLNL